MATKVFYPTIGQKQSGLQLDYVEVTSNLTVSATADASADDFIVGNALTFDGATKIRIEVYSPFIQTSTTVIGLLNLFDGSTDLGRIVNSAPATSSGNCSMNIIGARLLTPTAGLHTYKIKAWKTGGTVLIGAGTGGVATYLPAYYRVTIA